MGKIILVGGYLYMIIFSMRQVRWLREMRTQNITEKQKIQINIIETMFYLVIFWPMVFIFPLILHSSGSGNLFTNALDISIFLYPIPVITGYLSFRKGWEAENISRMRNSTRVIITGPALVLIFLVLILMCRRILACG